MLTLEWYPVVEHTHLSANDLEKQLGYLAPNLAGSRAPNPSPDIKGRLEQWGKHPEAQSRSKMIQVFSKILIVLPLSFLFDISQSNDSTVHHRLAAIDVDTASHHWLLLLVVQPYR